MRRTAALAILCTALALVPVGGLADDAGTISGDRGTDMAVDALLVRPLGLLGTAIGTVLTVATLPFTLPSGSAGAAAQAMIVEPAEYTFNRPLGDFGHCGEDRHPCGAGR